MASEVKRLKKIIEPLGFTYVPETKHARIINIKTGKTVLTCSGSPSRPHWWREVIRDLRRHGHIPAGKYY